MSDSPDSYDFAVIGGGSAGYAGARTAAALGLRTVVIDGADELGGLCILRGCMPSKALIASADRALSVRRGGEFGLRATLESVDTAFIRERKRRLIADFAGYRQGQLTDGRFELVRGHATFRDAHTLDVTLREGGESRTLRFGACLVATGSSISVPDVAGLRETGFWTSDDVLDAAEVPASFVVLGGGAIALEMAHYLHGIGRAVTVIQRSEHLLTGMDHDVGDAVQHAFERRGIAVHTGTKLTRVERDAAGKKIVHFEKNGQPCVAPADEVLVALGRKPATAGLALDAAGLEAEKGRLLALATQQTSQPHIFAAGDVCGPLEVVHLAIQQAELAARNAHTWLSGAKAGEKMDYRLVLFGVFSHPQAAQVGLTELEAAKQGREVVVAKYPFDDHGKSLVMGEVDGFVKMLGDPRTGEILGASVVGPEATELIHQVVAAMHFRSTAADFARIPLYHPTLSEIWSYPAEEIADAVASRA